MTNLAETLSTVNVVASGVLDQEIALEAVSQDLKAASYDSERFPGLMFETEDNDATCMVFRSGKVLCTGAESIAGAEDAVKRLLDSFRELGLDLPGEVDLQVENIVTTGNLGATLNLHAVAIGFGLENIEYEPEQFPGLVYRPSGLDTVILLFGTGKVVIVGATQAREAEQTIEQVSEELSELNLLE